MRAKTTHFNNKYINTSPFPFILDDNKVGYDIYCTNWGGLKYDTECHHAQISKLMDSKIVYVKNQDAYDELCKLREQTKHFLVSEERFQNVNDLIDKAKISFANAHLHEELGQYEWIYLG